MVPIHRFFGIITEILSVLALSSRFDGRYFFRRVMPCLDAFSTRSVESF